MQKGIANRHHELEFPIFAFINNFVNGIGERKKFIEKAGKQKAGPIYRFFRSSQKRRKKFKLIFNSKSRKSTKKR